MSHHKPQLIFGNIMCPVSNTVCAGTKSAINTHSNIFIVKKKTSQRQDLCIIHMRVAQALNLHLSYVNCNKRVDLIIISMYHVYKKTP